ncbi:DUF4282 domain-containing protein [Leucobacter salsicius]|uniref:DUF4282 domain-containing protein n=1 Tax=Leucobacter salsicius TaxID=664638 RepID=UPI000346ACB5|nr:DUF4282 domain-containing protein [Leucobacter salsicius]
MTDATPQKPAANWYPDPSGSGQLRFWDGEQWTQDLRPQEQSTALPGDTVNLDTSNHSAGFAGMQAGGQATGQVPGEAAGQQLPHQQYAHSAQAGFFRSLFDLSFAAERSVTTSFVKVIYVLGIALSVLGWLGAALFFFILGGIENAAYSAFGGDGGSIFMIWGVLVLIFGWIPAVLNVIFLRIGLEFVTAQIRTSQHTAELVRLARAA